MWMMTICLPLRWMMLRMQAVNLHKLLSPYLIILVEMIFSAFFAMNARLGLIACVKSLSLCRSVWQQLSSTITMSQLAWTSWRIDSLPWKGRVCVLILLSLLGGHLLSHLGLQVCYLVRAHLLIMVCQVTFPACCIVSGCRPALVSVCACRRHRYHLQRLGSGEVLGTLQHTVSGPCRSTAGVGCMEAIRAEVPRDHFVYG